MTSFRCAAAPLLQRHSTPLLCTLQSTSHWPPLPRLHPPTQTNPPPLKLHSTYSECTPPSPRSSGVAAALHTPQCLGSEFPPNYCTQRPMPHTPQTNAAPPNHFIPPTQQKNPTIMANASLLLAMKHWPWPRPRRRHGGGGDTAAARVTFARRARREPEWKQKP